MLLLLVAGVVGGIVNALAGGATLITFPAMLAAGLPPVVANASNAVAISPGHLIAALVDRGRLPPVDRRLVAAIVIATAGGMIGAAALLALPDHLFLRPVPALIGGSTLLFALGPKLQARAGRRHGNGLLSLALAAIYGGFFGAGLGIILTMVLSLRAALEIRAVKALKNLLATCVSLAAMALFVARGAVAWPETLAMLAGALAGGYAGGHLIRVLPARLVRLGVIIVGSVLTVVYALRIWFLP